MTRRPRISRRKDKRVYPRYVHGHAGTTTEEYVKVYCEMNRNVGLSKCAYLIGGKEVVA